MKTKCFHKVVGAAGLAGLALCVLPRGLENPPQGEDASRTALPPDAGPRAEAVARPEGSRPESALAVSRFDWRNVESQDYQQYIANLRAVGCPEETIRDLVVMDVGKLFAQKRAVVKAAQPFWIAPQRRRQLDEALRADLAAIDTHERATLEQLLGIPWHGLASYVGLESGHGLPAEKAGQVAALQERYRELDKALRQSTGDNPPTLPQQIEARQLRRNFDAELAAVLSPSEMEDYQLRTSPSAEAMRAELAGLDVGEDEFRQLFRIRQAFDDVSGRHEDDYARTATGQTDRTAALTRQQYSIADAHTEYERQVREFLGEQRYADYQRGQDNAYQRLVQVTEKHGLASDVADAAYEWKRYLDEQKQQLRASVPREQHREIIAPLKAQAAGQLQAMLGDSAFRAYVARGGDWVQN